MRRLTFAMGALVFSAASFAQSKAAGSLVEFEMMTWPEVKQAIHEHGKTTVLIYNGGTEQRGPQNVNGGHTLMARATTKAIAEKLGNAIAAPVLPFSPNEASADLPGTIGLTPALFAAVNERVAEHHQGRHFGGRIVDRRLLGRLSLRSPRVQKSKDTGIPGTVAQASVSDSHLHTLR